MKRLAKLLDTHRAEMPSETGDESCRLSGVWVALIHVDDADSGFLRGGRRKGVDLDERIQRDRRKEPVG